MGSNSILTATMGLVMYNFYLLYALHNYAEGLEVNIIPSGGGGLCRLKIILLFLCQMGEELFTAS